MPCPTGPRFDTFFDALAEFNLWEAFFCSYGTPLGELVVGTVVYGAFSLGIFVTTGSIMIPFLLFLILGGTVIGQMLAIISDFVALLILFSAPIVVTALIFMVDRRG